MAVEVAGAAKLVAEAAGYAFAAHQGQTRKGGDGPYIAHPLRVAALVIAHGGDAAQTAAALLHDTLEDCADASAAELRARFGEDVAALVQALTDTLPGDNPQQKSPWPQRKRAALARYARAGKRARAVACCDKLDNLRALCAALREQGAAVWAHFNATPQQTHWYYAAAREVLSDAPPALLREYDARLNELDEFVRAV